MLARVLAAACLAHHCRKELLDWLQFHPGGAAADGVRGGRPLFPRQELFKALFGSVFEFFQALCLGVKPIRSVAQMVPGSMSGSFLSSLAHLVQPLGRKTLWMYRRKSLSHRCDIGGDTS
jgi:hypothetical protein